jgi:molybdate transport system ATP-binding protein
MGGVALEITRSAALAAPGRTSPILSLRVRKRRLQKQPFALDVDLTITAGITNLFGPSGAGKTTLLECIAGLLTPDEGRIAAPQLVFFDSSQALNLAPQRRRIGYVFQDLALFPHLTVEENIQFGLVALPNSERKRRCDEILQRFRIGHARNRRPAAVSGGERQRVALARALVTDPQVLLLDEPLSALDRPTKSSIIADLHAWNQEHRIPILYVTHSREEVFALGEQVVVLEQGRVIAQGTPHSVLSAPRVETVAQLAGFENIFDVSVLRVHEERGTITCAIRSCPVLLETPLVRASLGDSLRVGIQAGDILLAAEMPKGLSAQNIIPGKVASLTQHDMIVEAVVDCGIPFSVHLTLAARDSLHLQPGREVWLVIKTHSCHLMAA